LRDRRKWAFLREKSIGSLFGGYVRGGEAALLAELVGRELLKGEKSNSRELFEQFIEENSLK